MKKFWILATWLFSSPLMAVQLPNISFHFPQSAYEWKFLGNMICPVEMNDEVSSMNISLYTHREGDALETMTVIELDPFENLSDELETAELIKQTINEEFCDFFPNHQIVVTDLVLDETGNALFAEWEFNDGTDSLLHGFMRCLSNKNRMILLNYMTTAAKDPRNCALWTFALEQASLLEEGPGDEESPLSANKF